MRISVILALLLLSVLLGRSYYERERNDDTQTFMRIGLDDVARRVTSASRSLRILTALNDETILAKVRAFARIVAADRDILKSPSRLKEICAKLLVNEVHVSDEKGVLVASIPEVYVGASLSTSDQSRPFMSAITNAAFELVQEPMPKGLVIDNKAYDGLLFQYAGVARIDSPGVVQVGQRAEKVEEARRIADVTEIVRMARVGRTGSVSIVPRAGLPEPSGDFRLEQDEEGNRFFALDRDCGQWRITVRDYDRSGFLARNDVFVGLVIVTTILVFVLIFLNSNSRRRVTETVDAISALAKVDRNNRGFVMRALRSTATVASALVMLIALSVTWFLSMHTSREMAKDVLLAGARDMRGTIDDCVDVLLFHQGNAICSHYKTPEAMTETEVGEVMRRYSLDELNVIDSRGVVVMGAIADRGFVMASTPITAKFNCLLEGAKTYSQPFRGAIENPKWRRKYAGIAFPPPAKGYIQLGFDEGRVKDGIDYWFEDVANGWHVADGGFYIVAKEETGEIDSCGLKLPNKQGEMESVFERGQTLSAIGFDTTKAPKDPDQFFIATLYGVECLCLSEVRCFHRVITAMPLKEIYGGILETTVSVFLILLFVFIMFVFFMTRLSDLVSSLKREKMASIAAQRRELVAARTIQMSSLPVVVNRDERYHIHSKMQTAKEVGGDFYDFYTLPDGRRFVLVADVSGKGISAAMFMMKAKTIIKSCMFEIPDFASAVAEANMRLAENNEAEMFVTCWLAAVNLDTGEVEFANAGHNPPILKHADGRVEWVRVRPNPAFAVFGGLKYQAHRLHVCPGDCLFLYTDGVTEAQNAAGEFFGEARLEEAMRVSSSEFVTEIYRRVESFVDGAEQADDITLLAFEYLKNNGGHGNA